MERDEHSSAERGAGDRPRDLGKGLSQEAEGSPEATPPRNEPEGVAADQAPGVESEQGAQADLIMSKLPRTRPQRVTGRRNRAPAPARDHGAASQKTAASADARKRTTAQRTTRVQTGGAAQRSAPGRPKSRAGTAARAAKQGTTAARATPASAGRSPRTRTATAASISPTSPPGVTPTRTGSSAPSLPRLAVDGAVEAAKLPLKVGGRLTLRALDAVARGLRGG